MKPHKKFRRQGNDLHMVMRITLKEALLGFSRQIKHLDDHYVKINQKKVTSPGEVFRIQYRRIQGSKMNFSRLRACDGDHCRNALTEAGRSRAETVYVLRSAKKVGCPELFTKGNVIMSNPSQMKAN